MKASSLWAGVNYFVMFDMLTFANVIDWQNEKKKTNK